MSTPVAFRFTLFDSDGVPWFGSAVGDVVTEADFQTPDPGLPHDRPYLLLPENWSATEVDFLAGASRIGAVSVAVLDKRLSATDQTSGIVTSRIAEAVGSHAVLERWDPDYDEWLTVWDGVVHSYSVDPEALLVYWFHLRDAREFERDHSLFRSNHVLFGLDGASGPAIDYGALPGGGYLLDAVEPHPSFDDGWISHFQRYDVPGVGLQWGFAPVSPNIPINLGARGAPVLDPDGYYYHRDVQIRWRPLGGYDDEWTVLRDMPAATPARVANRAGGTLPGSAGSIFGPSQAVYFGSWDDADLPETGQEIEFQILAREISTDAPFWWDGGTLGDLLEEIVAGEHTDDPPSERYDTAALAAFALSSQPVHFRLSAPVSDRRKWVEENIYQPSFTAPAFNLEQEIRPVSWLIPTAGDLASSPVLEVLPVGEWEVSTELAIREIEYTYIREDLESPRTIIETKSPPWWKIWGSKERREVTDPADTRLAWERLVETPVIVRQVNDAAPLGGQKLTYVPATIRSIGLVDGRPNGGDAQDDNGREAAERTFAEVLARYRDPRAKYSADVPATAANRALLVGDWVRLDAPWLPEGGVRRPPGWFQIVAIADSSPAFRRLSLVDSGVPDPSLDPDIVGDEDCLAGGTAVRMPSGRMGRVFTADGELENTCDHPVTLKRLLLIAGGGGGGSGAGGAGGGGGAGGVIELEDVVIGPGETIPVKVGGGGAANANGEDSVLWLDVDGTALDPMTDPEPAAYHAIGGGAGGGPGDDGLTGGSGGGAGASYPISGGSSESGGGATAGQGSSGGGSNSSGGTSTCQGAGAGGGGSYAGVGTTGSATMTETQSPEGGFGGPSQYLPDFGVTAGGGGSGAAGIQQALGVCSPFFTPGQTGAGIGAGGGGSLGGGTSGIVVVEYVGTAPPAMSAPTVSSTTVEDDGRVTICVDEADWPPVVPAGYRVRVDYAVATLEPDATSGEWRTAGYLEAIGCVSTAPVPTGATVWSRATAEAPGVPPSIPSTPGTDATPETPGLLKYALAIDEDGVGTVTWTPNAYAGSLLITGLVYDPATVDPADLERPLPTLDGDVDAADGTFALPGTVPQGWDWAVDLEAWESVGVGQGRIYRLDEQRPVQILATRGPAIEWGAAAALAGAATVADPLWGWYSAGDGATLASTDGTTARTWATLDHSAGSLLVGGAGVALTLASPTVTGTLTAAASVTGGASAVIPHGTAPTGGALVNGALWSETGGWYVRTNGVTQQLVTQPMAAGVLTLNASTTGAASLVMPHGTAPTGGALVDGAFWTTTAGVFARVNGVTQQFQVGTIGPTQGGTGLTSYTTGDTLYASASNVLSKLAIGSAGQILRVSSGIPSWTTATYPDTVTAGRLLYGSSSNVVGTLTLGSSGTVLTSNGSAPVWGTVPYGGMPSGSGTWDPGSGQTITISRTINLPETIINAAAFLRIPYRSDPAGPTNGDIWINSSTGELKWRGGGTTHAVS